MKSGLIARLGSRLQHFAKMRDLEMENGKGEHDQGWKQRTQYLQGRVESLAEAIEIVHKHCITCSPHSHPTK